MSPCQTSRSSDGRSDASSSAVPQLILVRSGIKTGGPPSFGKEDAIQSSLLPPALSARQYFPSLPLSPVCFHLSRSTKGHRRSGDAEGPRRMPPGSPCHVKVLSFLFLPKHRIDPPLPSSPTTPPHAPPPPPGVASHRREADYKEMQTRRRKGKPPDPRPPFLLVRLRIALGARQGRAEP